MHSKRKRHPLLAVALLPLGFAVVSALAGCAPEAQLSIAEGTGPDPTLPPPESALLPRIHVATATGWQQGEKPDAMAGTKVQAFARDLQHPRWLLVLPNGDVLVAESNAPPQPENDRGIRGWIKNKIMSKAGAGVPSANRITLLRDSNGDGVADQRSVFLDGLNSPFGMELIGDRLYVANTDAIVGFPYQSGQTRITAAGEKLVDLPGGPINHHWTKNIIASPDGRFIYAAVGSNSNVAEKGMTVERGRAAIWQVARDSGKHEIYASGLRNPVGMTWVPPTGELWAVVNERDALGGDLVPDYMTAVQQGGFYGWPWSYYGQVVDKRVKPQKPEKVEQAIKPDYALGPHTASLGLHYSQQNSLPARLQTGMFVGQHGSWNRKPRSGYKVIFVPFEQGEPAGMPVDVLTGFLDEDEQARGRPVAVTLDQQGALLVADDVGNTIWRVTAEN